MKNSCSWLIGLMLLSLTACHQEAVQPKVYGRYVPERKDDFAWENEYAAFRLYGPALLPENPSNGVDLWLKASPELVVDSFYYREHVLGLPYHINYGKGLDCYKVAHTCGAGGLVVLADDRLWIGGPYTSWEVLEQTPDKFVFRLHYDSLQVAETRLQADLIISAQAGQLLNKAQVVLRDEGLQVTGYGEQEQMLYVGGGIYLHDTIDAYEICDHCGTIAYAENALSDKQAAKMNFDYNGSLSQGRNYVAVITPGRSLQKIVDGSLISVQPYQLGDTMTYWFGACWSGWSNGTTAFPTDEAWFDTISIALTY